MLLFSFGTLVLSAMWWKHKNKPVAEANQEYEAAKTTTNHLKTDLLHAQRKTKEVNKVNALVVTPLLEETTQSSIGFLKQEIGRLQNEYNKLLPAYQAKKKKEEEAERAARRLREAAAAAALASSSRSSSSSFSSSRSWGGGGGGFSGGGASGGW